MIELERFEEIVFEMTETLPDDFFRELHGGIMVQPQSRLHPAAVDGDLFILGEYRRDRHLGRFIVLYYGSFLRCFSSLDQEGIRERIRKVILHEFRHHLESLAGEKDLEIEDEIEISWYKYRKERQKILDE